MGRRRLKRDYRPLSTEEREAIWAVITAELEFEDAEWWIPGEPEPPRDEQYWDDDYGHDEDGDEFPF